MKRKATTPSQDATVGKTAGGSSTSSGTDEHRRHFIAATDWRNRKVAGIYIRGERFYGQLWVDGGEGRKTARRFSLCDEEGEPCVTLTAAKEAFDRLKGDRRENKLPSAGRKPSFDLFAAEYLAMQSTRAKKARTQANEAQSIWRWKAHIAGVRVDEITTPMIKRFAEARLRGCKFGGKAFDPAHPRTVALDCVVLRQVLKAAADAGHLRELPRFPKIEIPPPPRRSLITPAEFDRLLACCLAKKTDGKPVTLNGEQLRDFLRLLACTGAREQEGLRLKWAHVDFKASRLYIGAPDDFTAAAFSIGRGGGAKNQESRILDFNSQIEALLREIHSRRAPDSVYLFPSPKRGERDRPAKNLRKSLAMVKAAAGLRDFGFHHLRVWFISYAVMSGVDFMTIAKWVGHSDGGILIGKTYGDIADAHRKTMAAKVVLGTSPSDARAQETTGAS